MTFKQTRLIENYVRQQVKKMLEEELFKKLQIQPDEDYNSITITRFNNGSHTLEQDGKLIMFTGKQFKKLFTFQ